MWGLGLVISFDIFPPLRSLPCVIGKLKRQRQQKQLLNVRYITTYSAKMCFHLLICLFTLTYIKNAKNITFCRFAPSCDTPKWREMETQLLATLARLVCGLLCFCILSHFKWNHAPSCDTSFSQWFNCVITLLLPISLVTSAFTLKESTQPFKPNDSAKKKKKNRE